MAATRIGIVYATTSGIVRRWIVPDDDAELESAHPLAVGESMIVVSRASIRSPDDVYAAVAAVIGRAVPSARCVVIDASDVVVGIIQADPALDSVEGHTLMLHETSDIGWTLVDGVLTEPPPT